MPAVGLFGPSDPVEFGFRFSRHRHLRATGPSGTSGIAVDDVVDALLDVHRSGGTRGAARPGGPTRRDAHHGPAVIDISR